ncbi:sec-independent protein translocase protein TatB [Rhizobium sp. RU20A]|uniref:Sec-independent protein translocase protein TatB n=1 Tax=Rhizobium sp. RU20A TaxID=1907412 RepID=UPI000953DA0E|nr:Sec-independent protein translocase protein TatB [Rhizobium sp. RU20A]SIQ01861.1 sec-independent protein translocase protein TatB [Rhizobium sp. RU20A]
MLDIGWTELVVIAIVLIVVVGPKDLPPMLRAFGRMTTKLRGMASDFRQQFDEALREAELDDVKKTIDDARRLNPANAIREAINPLRQAGEDIRSDIRNATRPATPSVAAPASAATPLGDGEAVTAEAIASGLGLPDVPVGEVLHSDPMPVSSTTSTPATASPTAQPSAAAPVGAAAVAAAPVVKGELAKTETVAAAARASAEKQLKRLDEAEATAKASAALPADVPVAEKPAAKAPRKVASPAKPDEAKVEKPRSRKKADAANTVAGAGDVVKKPRAPRKIKTTGDEA